jgi:His/Glu/Gln/Arg/opine family amino acid ABC transporter permease subunit
VSSGPVPSAVRGQQTPRLRLARLWIRLARLWVRLAQVFTPQRIVRIAAVPVAVLATLDAVLYLGALGYYNVHFALKILPSLWLGLRVSVEIIAAVIPVGFAIGFLVGWARTTNSIVLRGFAGIYVDFFRSMPPIVLIAFAYLIGLIALKPVISDYFLRQSLALWLAVGALALHTAAYQAEIIRAGILSVPAGQSEAADALGMSRGRSMFLVVLPQAFRVSLPALGNEFSSVLKDTSLLSVIGWLELSGIGFIDVNAALLQSLTGPFYVWVEIAILYFVLTYSINFVVRLVEDASRVPGLEVAIG